MTHEKLSKLEQAKEHWMLESQLLQVKYEKEVKVCPASVSTQIKLIAEILKELYGL